MGSIPTASTITSTVRMTVPSIVEALTGPGSWVGSVELIETHISWVFLAGDSVYKVKKPVDLGFLDFTTLEKRRFFCEEEVRLNQRLTHDVYLGVVELRGDRFRPGGSGLLQEVAVHMRRLPQDRMLDELVRSGRAEPALLEQIGRIVARFHAAAPTGGEIDTLGGLETIRTNWQENFDQTAGFDARVLPEEWRRELRTWVEAFLAREGSRFAARVAAGRSRDCHGDLQAQHVCCTEPIQIFDCIEFNHRFRYGDVASEIAFLIMDLTRLGRADLALYDRSEDTTAQSCEAELAFEGLKCTPDHEPCGVIQGPHDKPPRYLVPEANHQKGRDIGYVVVTSFFPSLIGTCEVERLVVSCGSRPPLHAGERTMRLVRYLQHWLSGTGPRLQVTDFVPDTHPIRQWADTFPWAALVGRHRAEFRHTLSQTLPAWSTPRSHPRLVGPGVAQT